MAHFLSDATHDRLFHRQEPAQSQSRAPSTVGGGDTTGRDSASAATAHTDPNATTTNTATGLPSFRAPSSAPTGATTIPISGPGAGLFRSEAFEGPIRCAAVTQTVKHGHAPVVWCGDTEGTLSLRNSSTGEVTQLLEQRERSVYAYAMCFVPNDDAGGDLWVGFSDGYLCVLDADTGAKKYETRAHGGALYAMQYHAISHRVYTAGADWQINAWNAEKMCRAPAPSQMSGHQNGIRSLCFGVGGNSMILYSGADDYSVRAWDITRHQELTNRWPAMGHKGGIHTLTCTGQLLFSGSTDGSVRVWSAAFGEPIRVVEQRNNNTPVNSLCFDEANNCVWAGGIDGIIRVWDATDLSLRAELLEHHNTHAACEMSVSRLAACKVWSLTNDGIHVHYLDTDGAVGGGDAIENTRIAEIECINDVDRRRRKVIECDIILNELRQEGEEMQEREKQLKHAAVHAMHHGHDRSLQQQYLNHVAVFVDKRRRLRIANAEAIALGGRNNNQVARRYWAKLLKFTENREVTRRQDTAVKALEGIQADKLRADHAHAILEASRRHHTAVTQTAAANALCTLNERLERGRIFRIWEKFAVSSKHTRREKRGREQFAEISNGFFERAAGLWSWHRLNEATHALHARKCAKDHANMMGEVHSQQLRRRYFDKWISWSLANVREMKKQQLSNMLRGVDNVREELHEKAEKEYKKDLDKLEKTTAAHDAHMAELAELRKNISRVEGADEAQINADIAEKERDVALIQAETRKEQIKLEELNREKRALQRELMRDASIDTSQPVLDQLNQAVYLLKARGVNVMKDQVSIAHAREHGSKKSTHPGGSGDVVYQQGLQTLRDAFTESIKPSPLTEYDAPLHWMVRGVTDKMHEKQMNKAANGLATLVTAYDIMMVGQNRNAWVSPDAKTGNDTFKTDFKHHEEVILNFGPLLDLAIRLFKWRRGEISVAEAPQVVPPTHSPSPARSGRKTAPKSSSAASKTPARSSTAAPRASPKSAGGKKSTAKSPGARATTPSPKKAPAGKKTAASPKPAAKKAAAPKPAAKKTAAPKPAAKSPSSKKTPSPKPGARNVSPKPAAKH